MTIFIKMTICRHGFCKFICFIVRVMLDTNMLVRVCRREEKSCKLALKLPGLASLCSVIDRKFHVLNRWNNSREKKQSKRVKSRKDWLRNRLVHTRTGQQLTLPVRVCTERLRIHMHRTITHTMGKTITVATPVLYDRLFHRMRRQIC